MAPLSPEEFSQQRARERRGRRGDGSRARAQPALRLMAQAHWWQDIQRTSAFLRLWVNYSAGPVEREAPDSPASGSGKARLSWRGDGDRRAGPCRLFCSSIDRGVLLASVMTPERCRAGRWEFTSRTRRPAQSRLRRIYLKQPDAVLNQRPRSRRDRGQRGLRVLAPAFRANGIAFGSVLLGRLFP